MVWLIKYDCAESFDMRFQQYIHKLLCDITATIRENTLLFGVYIMLLVCL